MHITNNEIDGARASKLASLQQKEKESSLRVFLKWVAVAVGSQYEEVKLNVHDRQVLLTLKHIILYHTPLHRDKSWASLLDNKKGRKKGVMPSHPLLASSVFTAMNQAGFWFDAHIVKKMRFEGRRVEFVVYIHVPQPWNDPGCMKAWTYLLLVSSDSHNYIFPLNHLAMYC